MRPRGGGGALEENENLVVSVQAATGRGLLTELVDVEGGGGISKKTRTTRGLCHEIEISCHGYKSSRGQHEVLCSALIPGASPVALKSTM